MTDALPKIVELASLAAKYKGKVVAKDLFDTGKRHLLNFGHTFGHAIEWWQSTEEGSAALPAKYSHGEAVAIGMVRAAELSEKDGLCAEAARRPQGLRTPDRAALPAGETHAGNTQRQEN